MELGILRGSLGSQPMQGRDGPSPHGSVKQEVASPSDEHDEEGRGEAEPEREG